MFLLLFKSTDITSSKYVRPSEQLLAIDARRRETIYHSFGSESSQENIEQVLTEKRVLHEEDKKIAKKSFHLQKRSHEIHHIFHQCGPFPVLAHANTKRRMIWGRKKGQRKMSTTHDKTASRYPSCVERDKEAFELTFFDAQIHCKLTYPVLPGTTSSHEIVGLFTSLAASCLWYNRNSFSHDKIPREGLR